MEKINHQETKENILNRIFLGFNFEEKYQDWYNSLCKDLHEKFDIEDLSKTNFFHITLKAPFKINKKDIPTLKNKLKDINIEREIIFNVDGFSYFEGKRKTVYVNTVINKDYEKDLENLLDNIKNTIGDNNDTLENSQIERNIFNMHASIARFLSEEELEKVLDYLKNIEIPFKKIKFKKIDIYKKDSTDEVGRSGGKYDLI
jgi:2'-5' RNA ligase